VCRKCGHTHSCAGKATQSRQCTCCRYVESPTAQTLFHKVKFDLLKAFYIVYFVSTNKKGITSTELSRKLNLRQKTCWGFKRKVMKAMESSENHPIEGDVEVDETVFGGQEENTKGRKNINKKLVVLAIEKKNKNILIKTSQLMLGKTQGSTVIMISLENFMEQVQLLAQLLEGPDL
jgi:hypothetical protein